MRPDKLAELVAATIKGVIDPLHQRVEILEARNADHEMQIADLLERVADLESLEAQRDAASEEHTLAARAWRH